MFLPPRVLVLVKGVVETCHRQRVVWRWVILMTDSFISLALFQRGTGGWGAPVFCHHSAVGFIVGLYSKAATGNRILAFFVVEMVRVGC